MKIAIIGAGNMGGAIARGMAQGTLVQAKDIRVSNPSEGKLKALQADYPGIEVTDDNGEAAKGADYVIVAVKPWLMEQVLGSLSLKPDQVLVSVAAGVDFTRLQAYAGVEMPMFRIVPNTAITHLQSMTLIASCHATPQQERFLVDLFNEMGVAMLIPESQIAATTALTSCGIAFVLKYIQAAMQAGVEMGIYPVAARRMVAQSVKGAAELLLADETAHPSAEIDKVTTPGGLTIKGINELEHNGFSSAVIKAMKACL